MASNGHEETADIGGELDFENAENPKDIIDKSSLGNVFQIPQSADLARTLLEPGNSLVKMLMKGRLPSAKYVVAIASLYGKCLEHNNTNIPRELMLIVSGMCAVNESRARLVSDTIIGERKNSFRKGGGVGDWLKEKAFGGNSEE